MLTRLLPLLMINALCAVLCHAQPTTKPAARAYAVTPMRVQQLVGAEHFCYAEAETTFANLKDTIDKLIPLVNPPPERFARPFGDLIFVYDGPMDDPAKPFKLSIGMSVKPGTVAPAGTKLRKLESIRAATAVYSGSLQHIGQAFGQLHSELREAGLQPTGQSRETYVYWEGHDSANNVIILQIAVK
jgi:effector-binding domain-containing protein